MQSLQVPGYTAVYRSFTRSAVCVSTTLVYFATWLVLLCLYWGLLGMTGPLKLYQLGSTLMPFCLSYNDRQA